jgi:ATP:corrinoid adenosyltransferase
LSEVWEEAGHVDDRISREERCLMSGETDHATVDQLRRASLQAMLDRNHWAEERGRRARALAQADEELEAARRRLADSEAKIAVLDSPSAALRHSERLD